MTTTIEQPPTGEAAEQDEQDHRISRLRIVIAVLAVIVVALGGALLYMATSADDDQAGPPVEVQTLIDDFVVAMETADYEAMQALVTDRFRRPFYEGDPDGVAYRDVWNIEAFTLFALRSSQR